MKTLSKIIVVVCVVLSYFQTYAQTENQLVVAANKMNVLYVGIDNPVSIAVAGISNDKLKVSIKNGTITKNNDKYMVRVTEGKEAVIEVATEIKPGQIKDMGSQTFRIKKLPTPTAFVGNNSNTHVYISKADLLKNPQVEINSISPIDEKLEIISFSVAIKVNSDVIKKEVIGNAFSEDIIILIKSLQEGSKLYIEDIKVKGPEGEIRLLSPIVLRITETE